MLICIITLFICITIEILTKRYNAVGISQVNEFTQHQLCIVLINFNYNFINFFMVHTFPLHIHFVVELLKLCGSTIHMCFIS